MPVRLIKKVKKVETNEMNEKGEKIYKSYTNFSLRIPVGDNYVNVAIMPVNFGEKTNRKGYSLLSACAEDDESELQF